MEDADEQQWTSHNVSTCLSMIKRRIVEIKIPSDNEVGQTITKVGGPQDGMKFSSVRAVMDDGTERWLYELDDSRRYFKQVFVPWDFEHPQLIG